VLAAPLIAALLLAAPAGDIDQHYARAKEAQERQDFARAAEEWNAIIKLQPGLAEAHSNLGMMYHFGRQYEKSIEAFRRAQLLNPRLVAPHLFLGIDYYLAGRPAEAIPELRRTLELEPGNAEARKWLGMSYMHMGEFAAAAAELSRCAPDDEILFHLARAYAKTAEADLHRARALEAGSAQRVELEQRAAAASGQALDALDRFAARAPDSWRADQLRAEYHLSRGEDQSALEAYQRALAKNPDAVQIHLSLGNLHATRREWDQAIAEYQAELKTDPYSAKALERIGQVHADLHRPEQARDFLERALALDPRLPEAHKALGKILLQQSKPAAAVTHLRLALTLGAENDPTVHFQLSKALRQMGQIAEAQKSEAVLKRLLETKAVKAGAPVNP
jgi:tetratricopeptide (TPR) repeat protein